MLFRSAAADVVLGEPSLVREVLPRLSHLQWVQATWAGVEPLLDPSLRRDYLKHGAPSARGHVVKGHVARPARNPAVDRTTASDPAPACPVLVRPPL